MTGAVSFLLTGAAFGASAGLAPGPLQALVISETLRYSLKEGIKTSLAPLLTDLPIILASVGVLAKLSGFDAVMGGVSVCGAFFLAYLAYGALKGAHHPGDPASDRPQSLRKAVIANFLNPHPYLFWCFVGAPTLLAAQRSGTLGVLAFMAGFYLVLVGTFGLIAAAAEKARRWIRGRVYRWSQRFLAGVLFALALSYLYKGLGLLGAV
jgi:threonine/homoserine/homoserine lactone efflux protein